jgi:predicted RNase H-like HicB family nuclease
MKKMHRFLIVIEKGKKNLAAYCPDLPGCVATGKTKREVEQNMLEAIQMHIRGLLEDGLSIPESAAEAEVLALPEEKLRARGGR